MDERKNLLGPNLIKNENIMPLLYQFLKVYQLKMTKQYQTRSVFENISTSIMTVDYSRVPSPSSCVFTLTTPDISFNCRQVRPACRSESRSARSVLDTSATGPSRDVLNIQSAAAGSIIRYEK